MSDRFDQDDEEKYSDPEAVTYYAEVHFGNPRNTYEYKVKGSRGWLEQCDYAVVSRRDGFLDYKNTNSLQIVKVVSIKDTPNYAGKLSWIVSMIDTREYVKLATGGVARD